VGIRFCLGNNRLAKKVHRKSHAPVLMPVSTGAPLQAAAAMNLFIISWSSLETDSALLREAGKLL